MPAIPTQSRPPEPPPRGGAPEREEPPRAAPRAVTGRALLLALVLIPLNAYWILQIEVIRFISWPTILSLQMNVVALLFCLALLNRLLARLLPRAALSAGELTVLYAMLSLATVMCGTDFGQVLLAVIAYPAYYGGSDAFLGHLPDWLVVKDRAALEGFYTGHAPFLSGASWRAWLIPLTAWLSFILALVGTTGCLGVLLARHWNENERLSYPIAQTPLALVTNEQTLFGRPLFWAGFALAATVDLWNGIPMLFPAFPGLPTKGLNIAELHFFDLRSQEALGMWPLAFYPFVLGMGMLMPVDLCFSLWFFYLAGKAQRLVASRMAWDADPRAPYLPEQASAAWLAVGLSLLWVSRRHLRRIGRAAWAALLPRGSAERVPGELRRPHEPLAPRGALIGLGVGILYLLTFSVRAGMPLPIAALFLLSYLLLAITLTRFRAESGAIAHDHYHGGPGDLAVEALGSGTFTPRVLSLFTLWFWFNRSYGSHPMPCVMEGFYLGERTRVSGRALAGAMLLAVISGYVAFFGISLYRLYHLGAATANVQGDLTRAFIEAYPRLQSWLASPTDWHPPTVVALTGGFLFTLFLAQMRLHVFGWPFHPVGYALASTWSMNHLWSTLLLAWFVNVMLTRYGGVWAFRRARPFYFGLILGEALLGSLWALAGILLDAPTYSFWP